MDPALIKFFTDVDHGLFHKINGEWTNSLLDIFFPFLTDLNRVRWLIPVVMAMVAFWIFRQRYRALMWIVVLIVSVGLSDLVSYRVIKSTADRARPEQAGVPVILRTTHHSGSSFPSNHAANAFAGASTLAVAFPPAAPACFLIAFLIAYSRVYVGVHFPFDVVAGAFIGLIIAFSVRIALRNWITRANLSEENRFESAERQSEKARRKNLMKRRE